MAHRTKEDQQQATHEKSAVNSKYWADLDSYTPQHTPVAYLDFINEIIGKVKRRSIEQLHLTPGSRVLDADCGIGRDAEIMAGSVGSTGRAVGVDSSSNLIAQAVARVGQGIPWLEFKIGDICALPFQNDSFDACRTDRVLQHLTAPEQAIAEMVRVTRSGGRISILEPDWYSLIIAGGDVRTTQRIVTHKAQVMLRHGDMGRRVPGLLAVAGCNDLAIETDVFPLPNLAAADFALELPDLLVNAVAAGQISAADAASWRQTVEALDAQGGFFTAMTGTITSATVL